MKAAVITDEVNEMDPLSLLQGILDAAKAKGLPQKALAERAEVSEEYLPGGGKVGSISLAKAIQLAKVTGVELALLPGKKSRRDMPCPPQTFREKYGTALAWSNPSADVSTLRKLALVRPQFHVLLDAALEFGIDRLERDWAELKVDSCSEIDAARAITERILKHIRLGYAQATNATEH